MKTKVLLTAGAVVVIAIICAILIVWASLQDYVNAANFDRITNEMTKGEVETIFGRPADSVSALQHGGVCASWHAKEFGEALFLFDEKGRLLHKAWSGPARKKGILETHFYPEVRE